MINIRIKKHSSQTFELKLDIPSVSFLQRKNNYGMDMFLFLPNNLGVNKHNYTQKDFYKSLKTYIRLSTPHIDFREVLADSSDVWSGVFEVIQKSEKLPQSKIENKVVNKIKYQSIIVKESVKHEIKRLLLIKENDAQTENTEGFIADCYALREKQKDIFGQILKMAFSEKVNMAIRFADEYQSLMLERVIYTLINGLPNEDKRNDGIILKLNKFVLDEMKYRKKMKYPSVANNNKLIEGVVHREGRLKRFIESVLFLHINTRKEGVFLEQLLFSLAAGLAMIFATSVVFASQRLFGTLTLPFFIIMVISYMFKDRIKELSRMYLDKKRKKSFFDFRTTISLQENPYIGIMKEGFGFESQKFIPVEIKNARENMRVTEIPEEWLEDKVILYKTKITLQKTSTLTNFEGISQILRFDISPFTMKMDDHEKEVFIKSKKNLSRQTVNHVYHLNLIFRFFDGKQIIYKYYKLITDKQGIKRINYIDSDVHKFSRR